MVTASAAKEAASRKASGGSCGRVDASVERGEGRDDVDITRSTDSDNKALPWGDSASFPNRQSKVAPTRTDSASLSSKRSKASVSSLSIKTDYGCGSNRSVGRINKKFHTANSPVDKIKREDTILVAPTHSNMSVVSGTKSCKSLSSIISNGGRSHESSGKASTTKPIEIETIQIHKSGDGIHNNHSLMNEHSSIPRKDLRRSELEYWSGLSVSVAMAVIQANGSKKMAQKASNIVLEEGRRQHGRDCSSKMMHALSAKLSVAMLEAGADQKVALAAILAVLSDENNALVVNSAAESMLFDDSSTIQTDLNITNNVVDEMESVASTLSSTIQSKRSKSISVGPSKALKRRQLNSLELQILEKQKAIEEAALWKQERQLKSLELQILEKQKVIEEAGLQNQEREKKFNERIAAYEAVTAERLAALDESTDDMIGQKDNGHKKVNACQRGIDDFDWWWCCLV